MSGALLEAYDELHRCCFLSTSREAEETKENIVNLKRSSCLTSNTSHPTNKTNNKEKYSTQS